jgi:hypothetical protein
MAELSIYTGPTSNTDDKLRVQQSQRSPAYDPVDKIRVSTPQSLIDTDFEYGQQPTKWEQVSTQNNRQSLYYLINAALPISAITGNQTNTYQLVVTFSSNVTIVAGTPFFMEDTLDPNANGWGYVTTGVSAGTSITIQMAQAVTTVVCYSATTTYAYVGYTYTGSGIKLASTSAFAFSGATITVTTQFPHGLSAGSYLYVTGTTGPVATLSVNGPQIVATTPTANTFTFVSANGSPLIAIVNTADQANIFARPAGAVDTHAYDGSVNFSAGAAVPNQVLFRQTRRYFRYQSGKGIQFSTGTILKPQIAFTLLSSVGVTVTVTCKMPHSLTANTFVKVSGFDQTAYNGTFKIQSVPTLLTFTYTALTVPTATPATSTVPSIPHVSPSSWYGAGSRIGLMDNQNGIFFYFDGIQLYAGLRNSVNQITGTVSVTNASSLVTGSSTQFSTQLIVGDFIVIRGQSYRVLSITSDTQLFITPEYRGVTISNALVSRTIDVLVPQSQWYDPCDGTGPSGYNLDLTRVQMFYLDYSWYGAGVARLGFRGANGAITYVYAFQNNNIQYQAYMRSGNLPSHYEQNNVTPITTILSSIAAADTTLNVLSVNQFNPTGGIARIIGSGVSGVIEYIAYTAATQTTTTTATLTGVTRGQTGGSAATAFAYSATAPIAVEYAAPDSAAQLSHWGSSVIMDGGFTNDVSLIYNYGMTAAVSTTTGATVPIMAIRVAPSVDNGTVGTLGVKEIINRLQLQMREVALLTTTSYLVQFILNGVLGGTNGFTAFGSPTQNNTNTTSIVQVATNVNVATTISGGESVAAFFSNVTGQTSLDITGVAAFGNSAMGGGLSNAVPSSQAGTYPDGPDILYVCVSQVGASGTAFARLSWQESQA